MPTGVIDKGITKHCGILETPELEDVDIKHISDIPAAITSIRKHRCGPKLKFGNKSISMEFRSGFYEDPPRYAEQLYILFGSKGSHKKIADLFDHLDLKRFKGDERLERIQAELKCYDHFVTENGKIYKAITEWVENNSTLDWQTKFKKAHDIATVATKRRTKAFSELHELIRSDINSLISSNDHLKLEEEALKERLIGVWFLAETFRYPPMLFYSLILLHLFINRVIDVQTIRELHPAYEKGSQKTLIFSFAKDSDCEIEVSKVDAREEKMMNEKKMKILQLLFDDVNKHLKSTFFSGNQTKEVFKVYCEHYLELCGIAKSNSIDETLDNLAKNFQSHAYQWRKKRE